MARITRYYSILRLCQSCFDNYVVSYEFAYDPNIYGGGEGVCELCGKHAILIVTKYVTVLVTKKLKNTVKFKRKKSI